MTPRTDDSRGPSLLQGATSTTVRLAVDEAAGASSFDVQVWRIPAASAEACTAGLRDLLDAEERTKAERFRHERDRRLYVTAHGALRILLADRLGVPPRTLTYERDAFGKPRVGGRLADEGPAFNLSHAGAWVLVALTDGSHEVGVDIERVGDRGSIEEIRRVLLTATEAEAMRAVGASDRTRRLFRVWTRKEAVIKAVGRGLAVGLDTFEVGHVDRADSLPVAVPLPPAGCRNVIVSDLDAPAGHVAAVAVCR